MNKEVNKMIRIQLIKEKLQDITTELNEIEKQIQTPEIIRVPDNIKILSDNTICGDGLGIEFGHNQVLLYHDETYKVWWSRYKEVVPCQLIKIDPSERIEGHTYFHTDSENPDFERLSRYSKYLGHNKYAFTTEYSDIMKASLNWKHWYKVVPIEE